MDESVEAVRASDERVRLFIGISPPPSVLSEIATILERLKKGAIFTGARPVWVKPHSLHVTLLFLGWQPAEAVDIIASSITSSLAGSVPFSLRFRGITLFPNPKDPRVISLGIHGESQRLCSLHDKLVESCRIAGFSLEERTYNPHLTLGRIKSQKGLAGLRDIVKSHGNFASEKFQVASVMLFKSLLHPDGAEYQCLLDAPLHVVPVGGVAPLAD